MKRTVLPALGVCLMLGFNTAHSEESPAPLPTAPGKEANTGVFLQGSFPHISRTDAPMRIKEAKPCREYLALCERSCRERGDMFKFACIGQDFQPFQDHFFCQCGDDIQGFKL